MTWGRLPLGGQDQPAWRNRGLVAFPGTILFVFAVASTGAAIRYLFTGPIQNTAGSLAAAILFDVLFAGFIHDFHLYDAWLVGSILTVKGPGYLRHCDLATAAMIKLRPAMPTFAQRIAAPPVLVVRQEPGQPLVSLLLRGHDMLIFPAEHLRILADKIDSRIEPNAETAKVSQRLRELADLNADPAPTA